MTELYLPLRIVFILSPAITLVLIFFHCPLSRNTSIIHEDSLPFLVNHKSLWYHLPHSIAIDSFDVSDLPVKDCGAISPPENRIYIRVGSYAVGVQCLMSYISYSYNNRRKQPAFHKHRNHTFCPEYSNWPFDVSNSPVKDCGAISPSENRIYIKVGFLTIFLASFLHQYAQGAPASQQATGMQHRILLRNSQSRYGMKDITAWHIGRPEW